MISPELSSSFPTARAICGFSQMRHITDEHGVPFYLAYAFESKVSGQRLSPYTSYSPLNVTDARAGRVGNTGALRYAAPHIGTVASSYLKLRELCGFDPGVTLNVPQAMQVLQASRGVPFYLAHRARTPVRVGLPSSLYVEVESSTGLYTLYSKLDRHFKQRFHDGSSGTVVNLATARDYPGRDFEAPVLSLDGSSACPIDHGRMGLLVDALIQGTYQHQKAHHYEDASLFAVHDLDVLAEFGRLVEIYSEGQKEEAMRPLREQEFHRQHYPRLLHLLGYLP